MLYNACVLSLRITFILGEKVGNSRVGERHLRDILVGEGGGKRNNGEGRRASLEEKDVREDCMRVRGFIGRETNFASN